MRCLLGLGAILASGQCQNHCELHDMEAIYVTAIRDCISARKYSFWTRLIMAQNKKDTEIDAAELFLCGTLVTAFSEMVQIN